MDLPASIVGTCPAAFSGTSGTIFLQAIMSLITSHCGINNETLPSDRAQEVLADPVKTYNFLIVGAGAAGSLLAGRLAERFPAKTVLVVEAGGDPGLDSEVPLFLYNNQNTKADWGYKATGDSKSCLAFEGEVCYWSQGRGLGGSSAINAMLYVRGHPEDYEEWAVMHGNYDWTWENVAKYFDRIEERLKLTEVNNQNPWYEVIKNGWKELGYEHNSKGTIIGTRFAKLLVQNGKRLNPAKIFLKDRKNLFVMKNTHVDELLFDPIETNVAVGVKVRHSNGVVAYIKAVDETILSAGTVGTPKILMLSGIGPKEELERHKIRSLKNLPVGKNLQDHILLPIWLATNQKFKVQNSTIISSVLEYMLTRTGLLSTVGIIDLIAFHNTGHTERPHVQFHHTLFPMDDKFGLEPYLKIVRYKDEVIKPLLRMNQHSLLLGIYPTLLHPRSRGEIKLQNGDPKAHPIIIPNYYSEVEDIYGLLRGIAFIQKMQTTPTFQMLHLTPLELQMKDCKGKRDDDYWTCYIKHVASTIYHPVGTCKMGLARDETSVVSEELLVHGVNKLRVVDASVMPTIPGANTVATTMMIAEKAADIIYNRYAHKDEL